MKAAVYHGRQDIRIESVSEPGEPGAGEILLEVLRGAICGTDVTEYLHGPLFVPLTQRHPASGHLGPMIIGHEFVGRIVAVGPGVDGFAVGQRVVPGAGMWCGKCSWCLSGRTNLCASYYTYGLNANGGLARFAKVPVRMCHLVADECSDDSAAMAQPLSIALHAVRRSGATRGQQIALIGVGGIGSFILAALHAQGFASIVALDVEEERLETARQLGAISAINMRGEDPVQAVNHLTGGEGVDVVIEASGSPGGLATAFALVRRGGRVLLVGMQSQPSTIDLHEIVMREVEITTTNAHICDVDLPEALAILMTNRLTPKVLYRVIPLDELVNEGILALAEHRSHGKVLVNTQSS